MIGKLLQRSFQGGQIPTTRRYPLSPRTSTFAGAPITDENVLGLPAAMFCVNLLADSVAGSPLRAFRNDQLVVPTPSILQRPNALQTRVNTLHEIAMSLALRGEAFALLFDFDNLGYPRQLQVLHPDDVTITIEGGQTLYRVLGQTVDRSEILHIKRFTLPGYVRGISPIAMARESLSAGMSMAEHAQRFFSEAAVPPVALVLDHAPADEEISDLEELRNQWAANHSRSRKPAVLYGGIDVKPIGFNNVDSQWLEAREFGLRECALIWGIPSSFLGAAAKGTALTYANMSQADSSLVKYALRPIFTCIESALSDLLPRGQECQLDVSALLQPDQATAFTSVAVALGQGGSTPFLTVDEGRALLGYGPMPPGEEPQPPPDQPLVDIDLDDPTGEADDLAA